MSQNGSRVKKNPALKVFEKAKADQFLHATKELDFFSRELMFIGFLLERVKDRLATDK